MLEKPAEFNALLLSFVATRPGSPALQELMKEVKS